MSNQGQSYVVEGYSIPFNTSNGQNPQIKNEQAYISDISRYFIGNPRKESLALVNKPVDLNSININFSNEYNQSSLEKFIFFSKLMGVPCVRVVSHSHIMQKFIKDNTSEYYNIKQAAKKNNSWSIFLKIDNTTFIITRHGYSIANYIKDKSALVYHKLNLYQQHQHNFESDPSLSLWGILTSIYRGSLLNNEEKMNLETNYSDPNYINVSILLRTWISAICLYLPYVTGNTITLVVTPYISESGFTPDNKSDKVDKQIKKFISFLNYLKELKEILESVNNDSSIQQNQDSFLNIIMKQFMALYNFIFNPGNKIIIKHIYGEYKIDSSSLNSSPHIIEQKIKIYNGVCKPHKEALKKMMTECETLSSKYNGMCNYQSKGSNNSLSLFDNNCLNKQSGGNQKTKKTKKKNNNNKIKKTIKKH
jgi:hypothetical protein